MNLLNLDNLPGAGAVSTDFLGKQPSNRVNMVRLDHTKNPVIVLMHGRGAFGDEVTGPWVYLDVPVELDVVTVARPTAVGAGVKGGVGACGTGEKSEGEYKHTRVIPGQLSGRNCGALSARGDVGAFGGARLGRWREAATERLGTVVRGIVEDVRGVNSTPSPRVGGEYLFVRSRARSGVKMVTSAEVAWLSA